jgi:branched-chain amino acid transport system permease protein
MTNFLQYLIAGIAVGCTYALLGSGFVMIYRVTQVVNLAQGTFAVLGGFFTYSLLGHGLPHGVAEIIGVLGSGAVGALSGMIALSRRRTAPLTSLVITLGIALAAEAVEVVIWGGAPISFPGLSGTVVVDGVRLSNQYILVVIVTGFSFAALAVFLSRSYLGKGMTACANNPFAARVAGINVWRMGIFAFTAGGLLGGLAGVLITPLQPSAYDFDITLAVSGFAAAIVGGLLSFPAALIGGLILGVSESMVAGYWNASYQVIVALLIVLGVLSVRAVRRPDDRDTDPIGWSVSQGRRLLNARWSRAVAVTVLVALAALLPLWLNVSSLTEYVLVGIYALIAIGLSLFMGFGGQVSAGQAAFFGIGAYTAGVMGLHGMPTVLGLIGGAVMAALVAAVIGVPVLRLRGNYLALATLAFQLIVLAVIQNIGFLGGAVGLVGIPALSIGGVQLTSLRGYAWLVLAIVTGVVLVSRNLVRSRPGRGLRALATSEVAAASSGIAVARYKLTVFALAAAYAGLAGGLYAYFIRTLSVDTFSVTLSIEFIVMIVVGGLGSIGGTLAGVLGISVLVQWLANVGAQPGMPTYMPAVLSYAVYGVLLIVVVRLLPGGLADGASRLADALRRIRRRNSTTDAPTAFATSRAAEPEETRT